MSSASARDRRCTGPWRHSLVRGVVSCAALAVVLVTGAGCVPPGSTRTDVPLTERQLATPSFDPPPPPEDLGRTIERLAADLRESPGAALLARAVPNQGGALWLFLVVLLAIAVDYGRLTHPRNLDLVLLFLPALLLFEVMRFFGIWQDPAYRRLMDWLFVALAAVSLALMVRAWMRMRRPLADPWRPNVPRGALVALTLVLLIANGLAGLTREPDDAGFYTNLGAQRLRERGWFPYGDPLLTGTPGAAYGPVLYLAHVPFQVVLAPTPLNPPVARPRLDAESPYYLPPSLATRLTTVTFHLFGVAALVVIGRRLLGRDAGWALAALYCGSAYVMGVGGERDFIGGMTFVSHVAPAAVSLVAFAALGSPVASGGLLAAAVATLFYPAFFFPAWLGFYWRSRRNALRFVAGFVGASLLIGLPVLWLSRPVEGRGVVGTLLHETQGHQDDAQAYGSSPFGLWGQRDGIRSALREPLVSGQPATRPTVLLFLGLVCASFFLARGRGEVDLALMTGMIAVAVQLWKVHGTGVYVAWYFPFLLIGFLGAAAARARHRGVEAAPAPAPPAARA